MIRSELLAFLDFEYLDYNFKAFPWLTVHENTVFAWKCHKTTVNRGSWWDLQRWCARLFLFSSILMHSVIARSENEIATTLPETVGIWRMGTSAGHIVFRTFDVCQAPTQDFGHGELPFPHRQWQRINMSKNRPKNKTFSEASSPLRA